MSLLAWVVILFLILVNALYVAAEFAAVGVRRSQIHRMAEEGNSLARRLLPTLTDSTLLDQYIAACQIGITFSSLVLGAYGQATVAYDLADFLQRAGDLQSVAAHSIAAVTTLIVLTALQVVLGELVPKSLALQFPAVTALYTYLPTRWSQTLYSPFIALLNGSGWLILRMFGFNQVGGHRHVHSPEEIDMLIAESRDGGLLEPEEQYRLHRALLLSQRTARQLMVPRRKVAAVDIRTPPDEVLKLVINSPYTRLPVYRDSLDNIVGLLHTKDVAARFARHGAIPPLKAMLRPVTRVPSSISVERLLTLLRNERSRQAIVMDEFGGIEGIVTLEDVVSELVGSVADEFKGDQPAPEILPDGRVRLPGMLRVDEAQHWTGGSWEYEGVDTVGGRILAALGAVPKGGEQLTIDGMEIFVERMADRSIASVLVTPAPRSADEDEDTDTDAAEEA